MEHEIRMACTPSREQIPLLEEEQLLYLMTEVFSAAPGGESTRLPLDICLVLDISSSMRGERLGQAKEAARYLVNQLTAQDRFSLITFNDRAQIVVPRQPVRAPAALRQHIDEVQASGGTEMGQGVGHALEQMRQFSAFNGVRRIVLLTDGQTYGDENQCVEFSREFQSQGIGITALGLGDEWNEDLLATMAAHGNSRTEYIAGPDSIVALFQEEMRLLQGIMAQEMSLSFQPDAGVQLQNFYRVAPEVTPIPLSDIWRDTAIPLGEWMGAGPQVFLAELVIPPLPQGEHHLLEVALSYRLPRTTAQHSVRYDLSLPVDSDVQVGSKILAKVGRALEKVMAYRLQEAAWKEARQGNIEGATRRLKAAVTRLVEMGEEELAQVVELEVVRLERTGQASSVGKKEIHYGTRRLGRRWSGRKREDHRE